MEDKNPQEKKVIRYHLVRHKWPDEIEAERNKKVRTAVIVCICIVCFLSGMMFKGVIGKSPIPSSSEFAKLEQIYSIMTKNWYFGKDVDNINDTLVTNAIKGMVSNSLDQHTMYMEPEVYKSFTSSLQGNFVGIGIQYYPLDEQTFMVDRVFKGSGAEAGGMIKGDIIIKVDGEDITDEDIDDVSEKIKGEEGTQVEITVLRENEEINLMITRTVINDSVYGYEKDQAGVLEISTFAETSGDEVGKYLSYFKTQGLDNLIIDLRGNSGGLVSAAIQIASYLIPEDAVVYKEQAKDGSLKEQKALSEYPRYSFDQIMVLIDGETASASEVLTSCLQAHLERVTTIGVKSYGKGTVQMPITFKDGSSFKYTIAEWLSPDDRHINGVGITPDIEVALDPAVTTGMPAIEDGVVYAPDSVSAYAKPVQIYLKFLGYPVDRTDEYFSFASSEALKQYQRDQDLAISGEINKESIQHLLSSCALKWHKEEAALDVQMNQALSLL